MASALGAQASVAAPIGAGGYGRSSSSKGSNTVNFCNKSWIGTTLAWESKALKSRHMNKIFSMSVQQASKSKVAVKPLELDNAKEPPLNLYKPKEPYTATIVSVERLVGPKAPGETCHIVIDHGGNVPYWEGQSYGVIPPVSNLDLFLLNIMQYFLSFGFV
jgi:ferredoxin--NADP+ reductase